MAVRTEGYTEQKVSTYTFPPLEQIEPLLACNNGNKVYHATMPACGITYTDGRACLYGMFYGLGPAV